VVHKSEWSMRKLQALATALLVVTACLAMANTATVPVTAVGSGTSTRVARPTRSSCQAQVRKLQKEEATKCLRRRVPHNHSGPQHRGGH
jgi:ABC-type thiamine transport system substrate-binding protein